MQNLAESQRFFSVQYVPELLSKLPTNDQLTEYMRVLRNFDPKIPDSLINPREAKETAEKIDRLLLQIKADTARIEKLEKKTKKGVLGYAWMLAKLGGFIVSLAYVEGRYQELKEKTVANKIVLDGNAHKFDANTRKIEANYKIIKENQENIKKLNNELETERSQNFGVGFDLSKDRKDAKDERELLKKRIEELEKQQKETTEKLRQPEAAAAAAAAAAAGRTAEPDPDRMDQTD